MKLKIPTSASMKNKRIELVRKKEIKSFAKSYLKEQNGYASSKNSLYNGVAIVTRGIAGTLITAGVIHELPKMIDNSVTLMVAQAATGIGSLAVALSRLENDKIATGSAKIKVKPFIKSMKEKGFKDNSELVYGVRQYMKKAGGFFTSLLPHTFSSKNAQKIVKGTN